MQPDPTRCLVFDYTCDDCMLPANHYDPPQINERVADVAAVYDSDVPF